MTIPFKKKQGGFTLLELVVVVAVLGLITNLATEYVALNSNQQRFDTTKERLEEIKYAIVGDDTRTTNGHPDLVGFVHDMGRLPIQLNELYNEPTDCDPNTVGNQSCTASYNTDLKRTIGWRGPYVSEDIGKNDGWGNSSWRYESGTNAIIVSNGMDLTAEGSCSDSNHIQKSTCEAAGDTWTSARCSDGSYHTQSACEGASETWTDLDVYEEDATSEIRSNEYSVSDNIEVKHTNASSPGSVCAEVVYVEHGTTTQAHSTNQDTYSQGSSTEFEFSESIPMGRVLVRIRQYSGACTGAVVDSTVTTIYPKRSIEVLDL